MTTEPASIHQHALLSHEAFLRGLARALLGSSPDVDDVVQETWLAALRARPQQGPAFRGWLARALRGRVAGRRQRYARRRATEHRAAREEAVAPDVPPAELLERQQSIVGQVLALDEPYRTTLLLRFFRDLSLAEIARERGVPVNTVKTWLRRGLERLRDRLDATFDGDREAWVAALVPALERPRWRLPLIPVAVVLGAGVALGLLLARGERAADVPDAWTLGGRGPSSTPGRIERQTSAALALAGFEMTAVPGGASWSPNVELELAVGVLTRFVLEPLEGSADGLRRICAEARAQTEVAAALEVDGERREQTLAIVGQSLEEGRSSSGPAVAAELSDLLISEPVRVGEEWSVPAAALAAALAPDAGLPWRVNAAEPPLVIGARFWLPSDWFGPHATGSVRARLAEVRSGVEGALAVIELEGRLEDEVDLLEAGSPVELDPQVRREALRARASVEGTGELVWELGPGRARSFHFHGPLEVQLDETRRLGAGEQQYRIHSGARLSGEIDARAAFHETSDDRNRGER